MKKIPDKFWLVPWSVGYECRTSKPDEHSIEVVPEEKVKELRDALERARKVMAALAYMDIFEERKELMNAERAKIKELFSS